ncbi:mCG8501, isoform CRA_a [Mus musculus]|nr:mCG8501, isoform CRA_a [Mus musculus]EDL09371.1 mCG8501, isoform CRA_a [Mus musculus]EDL09372.1 mCG8501, isoform CRA_a [Mus musculus]
MGRSWEGAGKARKMLLSTSFNEQRNNGLYGPFHSGVPSKLRSLQAETLSRTFGAEAV